MSKLKAALTVLAAASAVGSVVGQTLGAIDPHTGQIILGGAAVAGVLGHSITDVLKAWKQPATLNLSDGSFSVRPGNERE